MNASLPIVDIMASLAVRRPAFHSEADFQQALAWEIHQTVPSAEIRLEVPVPVGRLDVLVILSGQRIGLELKYIKKGTRFAIAGEEFNLPGSDANDLSRRDVVKDLMRIETLVRNGSISEGHVVLVTNEPALWSPDRGEGSQDRNFRLYPGRILHGGLSWAPTSRSAPSRRTEPPVTIEGEYEVHWSDFSSLPDARFGVFRYLALPVPAGDLSP